MVNKRVNPARVQKAKQLILIMRAEFERIYPKESLDITKQPAPSAPNLSPTLNLSNKAFAQIDVHISILSVLCGTIFGDSSIQIPTKYVNARFQFKHSSRQQMWFMWKALGPLSVFGVKGDAMQFMNPDGYQRKAEPLPGETLGKLHVLSPATPVITEVYKIICDNGQKTIKRSWLNHMNAYFLVTLWLDDGCLVGKRQGYFCINSTPKQEQQILCDYIKTVWQIDCEPQTFKSKPGYVVAIKDQQNLYNFLKIVAPLIPVKEMLYKVCYYPTNETLLQRWTSEIKQLVRKEWHEEIDKQYAYYEIRKTASDYKPEEDIVQ